MRRVIVSALALALLPAAVFAQDPPVQQPPVTAAPAAPEQPTAPKMTFTGQAGLLLVPIKPDQTAAFEEMAAKLKSSLAASTDETLKAAATAFKFYKASEPMGPNALYVVIVDPAVVNTEYDFFMLINKSLTPDQQRDPANVEAFKRWAGAFAAGPNRLNLTPLGGGI
ncbi:MAG: hypothetical protein M3541_12500 [Acidobacteriota bacterium]|nr:hypothetical protein [Acidobacteriota bacterium]MDQ3419578.1 hypothetical protein [Acidobacteriota bacterium]